LKPVELLLVEDNPGDILLISQVLRDEPIPIKIRVAVDGEQALQMLEDSEFRPDLVILDLNIPKVSGLSFLARYELEAPVVVFSSSSSPHDLRRSYELGAKEFVQKPSDLRAFAWRVGQVVRRWGFPGDAGTSTS
jgi:CheY-like chemotaxis protein